jgi:hypothetical protein
LVTVAPDGVWQQAVAEKRQTKSNGWISWGTALLSRDGMATLFAGGLAHSVSERGTGTRI